VAAQTVRQIITVAQLRHARAALIGNQMLEILRVAGISHIDDRSAVFFHHAGHGIQHCSGEVPGICDHSITLGMDRRLIGGAALQIVVAEPFRIEGVRAVAIGGAARIRRIEIVGGPCRTACHHQR